MIIKDPPYFLVVFLTACSSCGQGPTADAWLDSDSIDQPRDRRDQPDLIDIIDVSIDVQDIDTSADGVPDPTDVYLEPFSVDCITLDYLAHDVGTTARVPVAHAKTPTSCGPSCRQVSFTENDIWYSSYDVWGDNLVLNTSSGGGRPVKRVYLVDLTTLDHYILDERDMGLDGAPGNGFAQIFETEVLFLTSIDTTSGDYDQKLVRFFLESDTSEVLFERIYSSGSGGIFRPERYGDNLTWDDHRAYPGYSNIYTLDISTRRECLISKDIGVQEAYIWGSVVAFSQGSSGFGVQVYVHFIDEGYTSQVTTGPGDKFGAQVWEDRIVWTDTRNGGTMMDQSNADVYMLDLSTGIETPICTNAASQPSVVGIYGDRIVWVDCRHDSLYPNDPARATNTEIYMYDLVSGEETRLTTSPSGRKTSPKVFDNHVYFLMQDSESENSVFEITLGE